ncbi:MarR family transcriptional regulator [Secundilactobacillus silagei]|uniref:MarR family transcriptional regulator n=1 Tax=Secundilactobacillus silagei TaxID=1293415 RepID=UPI0006CF6F0A|nr:MarR family transcriptional regulator [Secundilactobacillus silagei]
MTTEQTVIALRQAISSIEDHRKDFHHVLETEMINDPRLTDEQLLVLKKNRFNHSEVEILSLVNQKTELPYKTLTTQVTFSQGMLSRYITKLLKADLLTKVTLPDNKKSL